MKKKEQHRILGTFFLLMAAVVWGIAFVAQSEGMRYMGPFYFNGIRFALGGIVLLPVILLMDKISIRKKETSENNRKVPSKVLLLGGIICGFILFVANGFQQIGIMYSTVGKAGFITTLYIIIVPILGIFIRKIPAWNVWISVFIAAIGLFLLCFKDDLSLSLGDLLLLACAFLFSLHILAIDYFSPKVHGVKLSCIQFFVSSICCFLVAIFREQITFQQIQEGIIPILYAGIMSCGVAYTFQIIGQKHMEPAIASLLLSLEAVVSVIAGFLILGQRLSPQELSGCLIVFAAVLLAQLPLHKKTSQVALAMEDEAA